MHRFFFRLFFSPPFSWDTYPLSGFENSTLEKASAFEVPASPSPSLLLVFAFSLVRASESIHWWLISMIKTRCTAAVTSKSGWIHACVCERESVYVREWGCVCEGVWESKCAFVAVCVCVRVCACECSSVCMRVREFEPSGVCVYVCVRVCKTSEVTREARVGHACRGQGLQHVLGATKRAFFHFNIIWNSDYRLSTLKIQQSLQTSSPHITVPAKAFHVLDSNVQITWDLDSILLVVSTIRQVIWRSPRG